MASFLAGQMRKDIANGFRGKLLPGILKRPINSGLDEYGDPITTLQSFAVNGFHDNYDEKYRAQAGIPITDSKITLILGLGKTDPQKDDIITISGYAPFLVRAVKTDPAKASSECQVYEIKQ